MTTALATASTGERNPSALGQGLQYRPSLTTASPRARPGRPDERHGPAGQLGVLVLSSSGQISGSSRNRMSLAPVAAGFRPS